MPRKLRLTPFDLAQRFVGEIKEIEGEQDHPFIQWCHMLCGWGPDAADEVPWCSSFVNGIAWLQRLPRSKSARARSWLEIGRAVDEADAAPGFDVVILQRGDGQQPGPEVIKAPGHVGFFAGWSASDDGDGWNRVMVLGGNQGNAVSVVSYPRERILGIRALG